MRSIINQQNLPKLFENKIDLETNIKGARIKLVGFMAANNLLFTIIEMLSPLLRDIAPHFEKWKGITDKRTKATEMSKTTAKHFKNKHSEKLIKLSSFFSLILDKTTDKSMTKQSVLTVTFYNEEEKSIITNFLDIIETPPAMADNLYTCTQNYLKTHFILVEIFLRFCSDAINIMVRKNHFVFTLIINQNPVIICVNCSCHSIHLVVFKFSRKYALVDFQKYFKI